MILGECKAGHVIEDMKADILGWYHWIVFILEACSPIIVEKASKAPTWFSNSCQVLSRYQRIVMFLHETRFIFVEEGA